jgi:hypothetical protein
LSSFVLTTVGSASVVTSRVRVFGNVSKVRAQVVNELRAVVGAASLL